jgi:uncharacterized phiE125 gp8 family phage protein
MAEPVSLDEVKAHLRLTASSEDASVAGFAVAARKTLEARLGLAFTAQVWRLALDHPPADILTLPIGPVSGIESVTLNLADGGSVAISSDHYQFEGGRDGRLRFNAAVSTGARLGALVIDFATGWPDTDDIPADLKLAVKLLAAHYFEHREAVGDAGLATMPESVAALIAPWRRVRL